MKLRHLALAMALGALALAGGNSGGKSGTTNPDRDILVQNANQPRGKSGTTNPDRDILV